MDWTKPAATQDARSSRPGAAERSAVYRSFWRKLDATLGAIEALPDVVSTLDTILKTLLKDFRQETNFVAARLYERADDNRYALRRWHGDHPPDRVGYTVPITYAAVQLLLERGILIMRETDSGFDRSIEEPLGVSAFAAMTLGEDRWLLSFSIDGEFDRERLLYLLSSIQHVLGQKLRQTSLRNELEEARVIQVSMLPKGAPAFPPYDIYGRAVPAEAVGGDLFDFLPISDRVLGIAVTDASGHGLPAALQARDAITGLRMGIEENLKIVSTVQKLNRVINRSSLAARFVSLFYGELEQNGNFIYTSAGHPPGLHYHDGTFTVLDHGGLVLGPDPGARYDRGFAQVVPGDVVAIYTDGITEAANRADEMFGIEGLKEIIAAHHALAAKPLVDLIFERVEAFSGRSRPVDDQTVVIFRRVAPH